MDTNNTDNLGKKPFDPFLLRKGFDKITEKMEGVLVGATIILAVLFAYDAVGAAKYVSLFLDQYGLYTQLAIAILAGLLVAAAIAALHRTIYIASPDSWRVSSGSKFKYLVYIAVVFIIQFGFAKYFEMAIFQSDIDRWMTAQNDKIELELRTAAEAKIKAEYEPQITAAEGQLAGAKAAFQSDRAATKDQIERRRRAGAKARGRRARRTMRSARWAGTRTSTIASIASARAAAAAALSGAAGAAAGSQDSYEGQTESILAGFDAETPGLEEKHTKDKREALAKLEAEFQAKLEELKAMDLAALVKAEKPDQRWYQGGYSDTSEALTELRKVDQETRWVILGLAMAVVLLLLVYKAMTWKYLFMSPEEKKYLTLQAEASKALMNYHEWRIGRVGQQSPQGNCQTTAQLEQAFSEHWQREDGPGDVLRKLLLAKQELEADGYHVPPWRSDLPVKSDPLETLGQRPWHLDRETLESLDWVDPTEAIERARKAVDKLRTKVYPTMLQAVQMCLLNPVYRALSKSPGVSYDLIRRYAQQCYEGSLADVLSRVFAMEAMALAGDQKLPRWPLSWPSREEAQNGCVPNEDWLRSQGWTGEMPKQLKRSTGDEIDVLLAGISNFEGTFGLDAPEFRLPSPAEETDPEVTTEDLPSSSGDAGQDPEPPLREALPRDLPETVVTPRPSWDTDDSAPSNGEVSLSTDLDPESQAALDEHSSRGTGLGSRSPWPSRGGSSS